MRTTKAPSAEVRRPIWRDVMRWPGQVLGWFSDLAELLPIEESTTDHGVFVIRVEIPGVEPDRDVRVRLADDVVTIEAERRPPPGARAHSEIRYGKFHRSVRLPVGHWSHPRKTYRDGILEIRVAPARLGPSALGAPPAAAVRSA